jgi:MFS family permease
LLQRNARYNILNAVAMAASINLINQYVGIFAVKLGATDLQLGYLSSWPNLASVIATLGAAAAVARARSKQRLIAAIFLLGRAAALGAAAVPWFPESARVWALIGFWVLAVFPNSAAGTAMQSFIADVFPGTSERGRAFATRNTWTTGAGILLIPFVGWALDSLFPYPLGYQIMFVASFFVALWEIYFFLKMKEPQTDAKREAAAAKLPAERVDYRTYLRTFSHRPFLLFVLCSVPFHFAWQIAWPVFTRYQVTDLHMNNSWLSWMTVANQLGQMAVFPLWARWGERYGNTMMLAVAAANLATAPFLTALATTPVWLLLINVWTGFGVAGVVLLVLNNQMDVSPAERRPVFLAVHAALVSISATLAPLVGAFLMSTMGTRRALFFSSGPRTLTAIAFLILARYLGQGKGSEAPKANRT